MNTNDQHLLIVRTVEDRNHTRRRKEASWAPEEVVQTFFIGRSSKAEDVYALRINARHDVLDGAVFTGGIERLQNNNHRILFARPKNILRFRQLRNIS